MPVVGVASTSSFEPINSSSYQNQYRDSDAFSALSLNNYNTCNSGRRSWIDMVREVLSIDYTPAQTDDLDALGDLEELQETSLTSREASKTIHQRRPVGVAILIFLAITAVGLVVKTKRVSPYGGSGGSVVDNQSSSVVNRFCDDPVQALKPTASIEGLKHGAVAADHPVCSQIGTSIMRDDGGNAVDAAVAVALCLGVANPASSGIGGGAFLLVHHDPVDESERVLPAFHDKRDGKTAFVSATGKITEVIDCREVAPAAADTDMFLDHSDPKASTVGGLAIAVPAELRGLELAHSRHGKLQWAQVVEPAMLLAVNGITVNANLAHEINIMAGVVPDFGLRDLLTHDGNWENPYKEGELLKNPKLGETLRAVMAQGSDALYSGTRAAQLAKDIQEAGGIITKEDIEKFRATLRSPVVARDINGFSVVGVPPPSSGGAVIIGALRFLAGYASPLAAFSDTLSRHRFVEACKHVFAIRMSMSDPSFNPASALDTVEDLTKGGFMESLRLSTRDNSTLPLSKYGGSKWAQLNDTDGAGSAADAQEGDRIRSRRLARPFGYLNDHGTTHFSVVDKDGNAVSMTSSVNTYFGSHVVSPSSGIVLNNQMDDFATPGKRNYFGLKPSEENYIKPFKKPLSSMSPTMVFRTTDSESSSNTVGDLILIIGASGGPKIITAVLQVIINHLMMGMPLFDSMAYPRLHDQLIYHGSAVTTTERAVLLQGPTLMVAGRTKDALVRRGHALLDVDYAGTVQAISIDLETNELSAVCDLRKGGRPDGY